MTKLTTIIEQIEAAQKHQYRVPTAWLVDAIEELAQSIQDHETALTHIETELLALHKRLPVEKEAQDEWQENTRRPGARGD